MRRLSFIHMKIQNKKDRDVRSFGVPRGDLDSRPRAYELSSQRTFKTAKCIWKTTRLQSSSLYNGAFE